jgi:lipase chaperone LimK
VPPGFRKSARKAPVLGALILLAVWAGYWLLDSPDKAKVAASLGPSAGWQQDGVANPFSNQAALSLAMRVEEPLPSQLAQDLNRTSLAGTQADGDWGVDTQGQLRASRGLRQRFDYFLSLIGEMSLDAIRAAFQKAAQKDLKEPALGQVMDVWERYIKLQQHTWKHNVNLRDPATWSAALVERQIMRRQTLGADWAHAFYSDEEQQMQSMLTRLQNGQTDPAANTEPSPALLHPQAKEREAELQAQWRLWEHRLDAARSHILQLHTAPELSALQRQQAIQQYLSGQFQEPDLSRARALIGL